MTNATLLQSQVTPNDCGLLARTLDRGGGCPGVCVGRIEVTGLTIYHPPVASDGGIFISQLSAKSLNLVLSGQQMSAQLHRHIMVVYISIRGISFFTL
jgi:hypothetical protein